MTYFDRVFRLMIEAYHIYFTKQRNILLHSQSCVVILQIPCPTKSIAWQIDIAMQCVCQHIKKLVNPH